MNVIQQRIREHCRWLREIGMRPERVEKWEDELLREHDRMAVDAMANMRMGQIGATAAAEALNIHRSTVYRRASRSVRKSRKSQNAATV